MDFSIIARMLSIDNGDIVLIEDKALDYFQIQKSGSVPAYPYDSPRDPTDIEMPEFVSYI